MDEDIEAFVSEENEPLAGLTITPSDVLVPAADVANARAIIEKHEHEREARAKRPDWKCPSCGNAVEGYVDFCDNCGYDRTGSGTDVDSDE